MRKKGQKTAKNRSGYELFFSVDRFYLYPYYFADISFTSSAKEALGGNFSRILAEFNRDHADYYINAVEAGVLGRNLFARIQKSEKYYKQAEKKILGHGGILLKFCTEISKVKLSGLTNLELYKIYHKYGRLIMKMRDWGGVPVVLDGMKTPYLSNYLMARLKKIGQDRKLSDKEISARYSILTSSERKSEVMQEEISRLKMLSQIQKGMPDFTTLFKEKNDEKVASAIARKYPKAYDLLKKHAQDFGWLTYYYIGPAMSALDVVKAIHNDLSARESPADQIKKIETHFEELPVKKAAIIKKLKLPRKLVYLFNVSALFTYLKDHRKGIYQKSYAAMDPVIAELAKRLELAVKEVKYLVDHEIKKSLLQNRDFSSIARRRSEYCVSHVHCGKIDVLSGDEATGLINCYIQRQIIDLGGAPNLKGNIAYAGKARGIVKIVINKADVDKVQVGDILVSPATNPDLIIAMKKAAALVTDRGGITSHAAIVSRELKKPCIVGTTIATKVLKDGDLVEVDAVKGIVSRLKCRKLCV